MEDKVKEIMASIFEVRSEEINEDTSPDNIENWDSIRHMNLIVSLEEEFGVRFSDDQIADMQNYKLVVLFLKEVGAK